MSEGGAERRGERILVVDDNRQNRDVAEAQLSSAGYAVTLAASGAQALELFAVDPPDLVLLDVMMPELDGFEVCRRLRKLPAGTDTPILFLTALSELSALDAANEAGGDDYLTKPINRVELLIRVRSLLRIKRMSTELRRSYDALARVEAQKAELSQFVVHDLKNPLSVILANAQFALHTSEHLSPRGREALIDVVSSADTMNSMLMNLLDIARSESGTLTLQRASCDLGALVTEATDAVRMRADERGMVLYVAAPTLVVSGDRHMLRRVLDNLLDNALKYAPKGSELWVSLAASDDGVRLSVRDEGAGVPDALKQRVFEKFVQLDEHAASHGRLSRGLGLAFCKLAIEAHGGMIWTEDAVPQGTVFHIRLPFTAALTAG